MAIARDVILDLLPIYLAGEASPATRALVEEYLAQDPELARRTRLEWEEGLARAAPSPLPPELELRSLRRTRRLLVLLRWLFGFAIAFSSVAFATEISFKDGKLEEIHLMLRDYPAQFGVCLLLGLACWTVYFVIRRRLRTTTTSGS